MLLTKDGSVCIMQENDSQALAGLITTQNPARCGEKVKEMIIMAEEFTIKEYERAEAELRTRKRHANFYTHAALYVLINALLIIINVAFLTAYPWCLIPLVLWGVGLLAHYFEAFVWVANDTHTWEAKIEHRASQIHSETMA